MEKREKKEIQNLILMLEDWINGRIMPEATKIYKDWRHDKNSYAFGFVQGLRAVLNKLYEIK
jgi:hypothetical protein